VPRIIDYPTAMSPVVADALSLLGLRWPTDRAALDGAYRNLARNTHPLLGGPPRAYARIVIARDLIADVLSGQVSWETGCPVQASQVADDDGVDHDADDDEDGDNDAVDHDEYSAFVQAFRRSAKGNLWQRTDSGPTLSVFVNDLGDFCWCVHDGPKPTYSAGAYSSEDAALRGLYEHVEGQD
jgi:hypothetical protein